MEYCYKLLEDSRKDEFMGKTALATQISEPLKHKLDDICEERGLTISHFVESALKEKIEDLREEEALLKLALKRLAESGECSYTEYKHSLTRMK